jgi:hypothetical protein
MDDLKNRIDDLCRKLITLPDDSDEWMAVTLELRAALGEHASRLRKQLSELREKGFLPPDQSRES